jgi:hypothetical protein
MKSLVLFCIGCLVLSVGVYAQTNLVLNPSFETATGCPVGPTEFYRTANWNDSNSGADTCASPDLYATCAPQIGGVNSPNALLGTQASRTGSLHAGIILYEGIPLIGCDPIFSSNYREYIEGKLSSPMVAGQRYCVKFYTSLADGAKWATDDIGVYLSNTLFTKNFCSTPGPHSVTPQLNWCGASITNTTNWVELKWTYIAQGGELFFTIGNYKSDSQTTRTNASCNSIHPYMYYFIDDVSITQGCCPDSIYFTNVVQPSCSGGGSAKANVASTTCGASAPTYLWSNGVTNATAANLATGTYTVTVTVGTGCKTIKTVTLTSTGSSNITPTFDNIPGQCGQNGLINMSVSGGTSPYTYLWSNGRTTQDLNNIASGCYTVTITDNTGCSKTSQSCITNTTAPTLTENHQNTRCGGRNGSINTTATGGTPPYVYTWNTGQTIADLANLSTGQYCLTLTDANVCTKTLCVNINASEGVTIEQTETNPDCGASNGAINLFISSGTSPFTYLWDNGATTESLLGIGAGDYCVTVTDAAGCDGYICTSLVGECCTPTNPRETLVQSNKVTIAWDAVVGALDYEITGGVVGNNTQTLVTTNTSRNFVYPTIRPNKTYQWRVRARCGTNTYSGYTAWRTVTTPTARTDAESIPNNTLQQAVLQPNPTTQNTTIQFSEPTIAQIYIYDTNGTQVAQHYITQATSATLPVQNLTAGLYIITIVSPTQVQSLKLIKE